MLNDLNISHLVGKTLTAVNLVKPPDEIVFTVSPEEVYKLYHSQDCCEVVTVEDICGNLEDLVGSPILQAEESTNSDEPKPSEYADSFTWTFYRLATMKGSVVIRWLGESKGYYSESVDFKQVK